MVGKTLSHYRILEELGRGGMGIVYKAQDTKLDRMVALKVLPASALSSEDDRARFYREAKAAAQLHHPHIAGVFEIDQAVPEGASPEEPRPFIAMEFVDGESLHERVKAGPMQLEEVVRITTQVAQALEVAHEKGIVHRDIKAANIMMTAKREAKVLDFGLAKTIHSTMLTRMGSTVGTTAYMSPEQTRGSDVDYRSDLWSLGVLMYEMIAGKLPFGGDYEQAIAYSILNEEPEPLTAIRTGVPMGLEWIATKLLTKKADDRYQSAKDLLVDLRTVDLKAEGLSRKSMPATGSPHIPSRWRRAVPALAWAGVGALAVGLFTWLRASSPGEGTSPISPKHIVQTLSVPSLTGIIDISPLGDRVAFAADEIRVLDLRTGDLQSYPISGLVVHVDFSDDGSQLLLTTAAGVQWMSLNTGSVVNVVSTSEGGPRAEWRNEDIVLYEESQSIFEISLTTSETRRIVRVDSLNGEYDIDFPFVLPDGKTLMATSEFRDAPSRIGFWDIHSGRNLGYINYPGYRAQYVSPGYLVFSMDGDAMALPFDLKTREQRGAIIPIRRRVRPQGLSISRDGTLVLVGVEAGVDGPSRPVAPIVYRRVNRSSADIVSGPERFPAAVYRNGVVHPNGNSAAVVIQNINHTDGTPITDIWILDFTTGTRRALTRDGTSDFPAWSARGDSVYFVRRAENDAVMVMAASGRGDEKRVLASLTPTFADLAVSPNGRWAAFAAALQSTVDTQSKLFLWDLRSQKQFEGFVYPFTTSSGGRVTQTTGEGIALNTSNGNPRQFSFSPSSRFLAFEDQGGIYVLSMDDLNSAAYPVWENSMSWPRWAPDESKLFGRHQDGSFRQVEVRSDPVFATVSAPSELFPGNYGLAPNLFDVFPDGQRFLVAQLSSNERGGSDADSVDEAIDLHFIINLPAELAK